MDKKMDGVDNLKTARWTKKMQFIGIKNKIKNKEEKVEQHNGTC